VHCHIHYAHPTNTVIYPLSLHDALPISSSPSDVTDHSTAMTATAIQRCWRVSARKPRAPSSCQTGTRLKRFTSATARGASARSRSEEHTSELQSHLNLVCRLLLEKKKTK